MIPDGIPLKEMDMNLATCVQMVAGKMKLDESFCYKCDYGQPTGREGATSSNECGELIYRH